jgi:hypothetical protein
MSNEVISEEGKENEPGKISTINARDVEPTLAVRAHLFCSEVNY